MRDDLNPVLDVALQEIEKLLRPYLIYHSAVDVGGRGGRAERQQGGGEQIFHGQPSRGGRFAASPDELILGLTKRNIMGLAAVFPLPSARIPP